MTQHLGRGGLGGVVALLLAGCGGTVDLRADDGTGGSGTLAGSGGSSAAGSAAIGGSTGSKPTGGGPAPTEGALAYDANPDALGRAVYVSSFAEPKCIERLTDPTVQAKQPAFSADGAYLTYAAQVDGLYQIHVRDLTSGDVAQVTSEPTGATSPAFSPDGATIAFVTGDPETIINRAPGSGNLMLLDREHLEVSLLAEAEGLGCCVAQYLSPVFNGPDEILVGTRASILGIDLLTGHHRDLVPFTGRIPSPQDPSPAPDGIRYAFSDNCGSPSLFIGRVDGSTGDTCDGATGVGAQSMVSVDWGPSGFLAAEIQGAPHGVVLLTDDMFVMTPFAAPGARNPAWAPAGAEVPIACD